MENGARHAIDGATLRTPTTIKQSIGSALVDDAKPLSALPSVGLRVAGFVAICLSGLAGAVIGSSLVSLQCDGECAVPIGIGMLAGAVIAAGGMAIVAVLVMRAMGEWREIEDRERAGHAPR
jgi:hypothetical protein